VKPVEPRPAATIVLIRRAAPNFEALLLERPQAARFAPGAFVFPGGAVDVDDSASTWGQRLPPVGEQVACAAALRELFEETGILPAGSVEPDGEAIGKARQGLLDGRNLFSTLAERMDWDFSGAPIAYFARWITPRTVAMRFDTRFFLLLIEDGDPTSVSVTDEHVSSIWIPPDRALQKSGAGELPLLFPTRKTLERLAGFKSRKEAFHSLREKTVEPILPKLDLRRNPERPLMPGDKGYEEAF
jgi:recombination protein RecT